MASIMGLQRARKKPKRELFDKLTSLLKQRLGGKEAYVEMVSEIRKRPTLEETADFWTNFNALNQTSLHLLIKALERSNKAPDPDANIEKMPLGIKPKLKIDVLKRFKFSDQDQDPRSLRY